MAGCLHNRWAEWNPVDQGFPVTGSWNDPSRLDLRKGKRGRLGWRVPARSIKPLR